MKRSEKRKSELSAGVHNVTFSKDQISIYSNEATRLL